MKVMLTGSLALGAIGYLVRGDLWTGEMLAVALAVVWACVCSILGASLRPPRREWP